MILLIIVMGMFGLCLTRFIIHRNFSHKRAGDYRVIGHCLLILVVVLYFYDAWNAPEENASAAYHIGLFIGSLITLGIPAALFYLLGRRRDRKMQQRYYAYQQLVQDQGINDIYRIATIMRIKVEHVLNDLTYLIEVGYIPNVWTNEYLSTPDRPVTVSVTCTGCGSAASMERGTSKECEYCGKKLFAPA